MRADGDLPAACAIINILRRGRYDVFHAHTSHAVGLGAMAAPFGGWPARIYTRRLASSIHHRWKYLLGTDVCIGISRAVVQRLLEDGIPRDRVAYVPSGVEIPANGAQGSAPSLRPVIGTVAHLEREKGIDILLEAMVPIGRSHPDATLVIVGDGPERDRIEEKARSLGGRVRLLGHRDDVPSILPSFDVYVAPSRKEALGTSILAAQAHGLPVVASWVGGTPEVVEDGRTGLLVSPESPEEVARAVARLLDDPPLRRRLGRAAREQVAAEYSTERMVSGTLEVYRRVIRRRRRSRGR
jgi:glycosyltransferase involved in cell wall biosynthesis